jgi:D-alanyl-D-alanine carboxypeptidase
MAVERCLTRGRILICALTLGLTAVLAISSNLFFASRAEANPVASSIVVDAATGDVLSASNADAQTYPASLTKMMTLYLLFEALDKGKIKLSDQIVFSDYAASRAATNLNVQDGDSIRVETAILAVVVRSANDVATAIGERLGGSEWTFAKQMTAKAQALGMSNTIFRNACGLPDPGQHTTARDMAILGVALLRDYPQYYRYFSSNSFSYRGVNYTGHNRVLRKFAGADGIKTGYIRASGFNLVTSAERNGRRLVGVVLGGISPTVRDKQMMALMTKGFGNATGIGQTLMAKAPASAKPAAAGAKPVEVASVAAPQLAPAPAAANMAAPKVAAAKVGEPKAVAPNVIYLENRAPEGDSEDAAVDQAAQDPIADQITASNDILPVLKPGSTVTLTSAGGPDEQAIANVWHPAGDTYGIQVGAYSQFQPAQKAAAKASQALPSLLADARVVIDQGKGSGGSLYRARVMGLSKADAEQACAKLRAKSADCMVLNEGENGLAKAN